MVPGCAVPLLALHLHHEHRPVVSHLRTSAILPPRALHDASVEWMMMDHVGCSGNGSCNDDEVSTTSTGRLMCEGFRAAERALQRGECALAAECLSYTRLFIKVETADRLALVTFVPWMHCWMRSASLTCVGSLLAMVRFRSRPSQLVAAAVRVPSMPITCLRRSSRGALI